MDAPRCECPNGHPVELVEMLPCNAKDCMAMIAYEPTAHGLALVDRLGDAEMALSAIVDFGDGRTLGPVAERMRERAREGLAAVRGQ